MAEGALLTCQLSRALLTSCKRVVELQNGSIDRSIFFFIIGQRLVLSASDLIGASYLQEDGDGQILLTCVGIIVDEMTLNHTLFPLCSLNSRGVTIYFNDPIL